MFSLHRKKPGFTLVELLLVVAIIGILALLAIFSVTRAQTHAKNAVAQSSVNSAGQAIEVFRNDDSSTEKVISNDPSRFGSPDSLTGTVGNLNQIFTGELNTCTTGCSYPANITSTPGSKYTYTYTVTTPSNGYSRELVGETDPFPILYRFCTTIINDDGTTQWKCIDQDGNTVVIDYDPSGAGSRIVPHTEKIPNGQFASVAACMAVICSDDIYLIGGAAKDSNYTPVKTVYDYHPSTRKFDTLDDAHQLSTAISNSTGVYSQAGNAIYIFGGSKPGSTATDNIYRYDPMAGLGVNSTTVVGHLAVATLQSASAYDSKNGKVYIVGGASGLGDNYIQEFDPNNPTTTKMITSSMPGREHTSVIYDNVRDKIIIIGGFGHSPAGPLNDVWTFTPADNIPNSPNDFTQTAVSPLVQSGQPVHLPGAVSSLSAAWDPTNERAFILAGYGILPSTSTWGALSSINIYDGCQNSMLNRQETLPANFTDNTVIWDQSTQSAFTFGGYRTNRITGQQILPSDGSIVEYITTPFAGSSTDSNGCVNF